jgi:hypothetical protein
MAALVVTHISYPHHWYQVVAVQADLAETLVAAEAVAAAGLAQAVAAEALAAAGHHR